MNEPLSIRMKLILLQKMQELSIRKSELARRLKKSPQSITRLTNINYTSNANHIQDAFKAIGVTLSLKVVETTLVGSGEDHA